MRFISISIFLLLALSVSSIGQDSMEAKQTRWIEKSLKEIEKIKVNMTLGDLLKVFTTEGGTSTPLDRTYVYRKCPFIKVDVVFEPVGRPLKDAPGRILFFEDKRDLIKSISKPYLEWSIVD